MTNDQFKKFLETLLHIIENEPPEKVVKLLKQLIES